MALIVLLTIVALVMARLLRAPRRAWRGILAVAVAAAAATQLLPAAHPLRLDVADSSRNLAWVALALVPVALYALLLQRIRRRTGVTGPRTATAEPPEAPRGLVQIADDRALCRETESALAADAAAALQAVLQYRSLGWRAEDGTMAGHLRLAVTGESCEILAFRVADAHRGAGIGRALLRGADDVARELGARQMVIRVGSWQAVGVLRRAGFQTVWEQALGGGAKWCWMEKDLT